MIGRTPFFGNNLYRLLASCMICIEGITSKEITAMESDHYFCNEYWTNHFIVMLNKGEEFDNKILISSGMIFYTICCILRADKYLQISMMRRL